MSECGVGGGEWDGRGECEMRVASSGWEGECGVGGGLLSGERG